MIKRINKNITTALVKTKGDKEVNKQQQYHINIMLIPCSDRHFY